MSRIDRVFADRGARPLIIPFVTAGYPQLDSTVSLVHAMKAAGADLVEIGVPFSDPLADGPTIQRSSERALSNGMTVERVLSLVAELRADSTTVELPLVLMGYCNPIFRFGLEEFLRTAAETGVDGLIVPDLPPEEATDYRDGCTQHGLAAVFLMAPNATDERIGIVDKASTHFSYCVSVTGVTGTRGDVHGRTIEFLDRVRRQAHKPFVVGFGVKQPEHVKRLGPLADGVVVGSALIDAIDEATNPAGAVGSIVKELRAAADELAVMGTEKREGE